MGMNNVVSGDSISMDLGKAWEENTSVWEVNMFECDECGFDTVIQEQFDWHMSDFHDRHGKS
jgi:hypothetical protein